MGLKIYPDPVVSGGSTFIMYQLPVAGISSLAVYAISGRQMGIRDLGSQPAGSYTLHAGQLPVDPSRLPNGYYVLKLVSTAGTAHVPFLVIRH